MGVSDLRRISIRLFYRNINGKTSLGSSKLSVSGQNATLLSANYSRNLSYLVTFGAIFSLPSAIYSLFLLLKSGSAEAALLLEAAVMQPPAVRLSIKRWLTTLHPDAKHGEHSESFASSYLPRFLRFNGTQGNIDLASQNLFHPARCRVRKLLRAEAFPAPRPEELNQPYAAPL